jgi:hypothetical protein
MQTCELLAGDRLNGCFADVYKIRVELKRDLAYARLQAWLVQCLRIILLPGGSPKENEDRTELRRRLGSEHPGNHPTFPS